MNLSKMGVRAVAADRLPELLQRMPKAELHMHIEGSLEPELIFAMARRNGVSLPYPDVESLRGAYVFDNLQSFLDIYHQGTMVLKTEQDFYDMAHAYLKRAAADNVLHSEIFFDTQTHTGHGLDSSVVINGLHRACGDAKAQFGMTASLILCFLRHLSEEEAFAALEQALPMRDKIVGIGLASSELGHPPEKFRKVFSFSWLFLCESSAPSAFKIEPREPAPNRRSHDAQEPARRPIRTAAAQWPPRAARAHSRRDPRCSRPG